MNSVQKQRGVATILFVILLGITVMVVTAAVAKNISGKKEATVAAHAQTNAQMMAWAGVSAFQQYVANAGSIGTQYVTALNGTNVTLRNDNNEVIAKNIKVTSVESDGTTSPANQICVNNGAICTVSADISANDKPAQAATTINTVFNMTVNNGIAQLTAKDSTYSFGGNTTFSGTSLITLASATPNANVTLNVDGNLSILTAALNTKNISVLNINSSGNVYIDCSATDCGSATMNITAKGTVQLLNGGKFGTVNSAKTVLLTNSKATDIVALDTVTLTTGSVAKSITTKGDVSVSASTVQGSIQSVGNVTVSASTVNGDVNAIGNVNMDTGGTVTGSVITSGTATLISGSSINGNLYAQKAVSLSASTVNGDIRSGKDIWISASTVGGNVEAYDYVRLDSIATVKGSVYAKGNNLYTGFNYGVSNIASHILGSVYAKGSIYNDTIGGIGGSKNAYTPYQTTPIPQPTSYDFTTFQNTLTTSTTLGNKVDVKAYLGDANYIFLRTNTSIFGGTSNFSVNRVYLNQVKNKINTNTYVADCTTGANSTTTTVTTSSVTSCTQSVIDNTGLKTKVNNTGFALGNYIVGGNTYTGAICLTVNASNQCTTDIIGYLPRISITTTLGLNDAYAYSAGVWYVRSLNSPSDLNNAALAPGVMYFDGNLDIAGQTNINADSTTSAYVNSFLAEGYIEATAGSPTIYSPYNVVKGNGTADLVCNRTLKSTNGTALTSMGTTSPATTLSDKYLKPVNLCKSDTTFAYNMDKNADGSQKNVSIDNTNVAKLDLGNVALMANSDIRVGACSRIFGNILARGHFNPTAGCGITNTPNNITGLITTQGMNLPTAENTLPAGINLTLPGASGGGAGTAATATVATNSLKLVWTKML